MGYSYDHRGRLACDCCGGCGTTRKRTCPHRVTYRASEGGGSLPYCYPSALCSDCYAKHKPTLHKDCAAGAALRQAEYDADTTRWGDWDEDTPAGFIRARYVAINGTEAQLLYPKNADNEETTGRLVRSMWLNTARTISGVIELPQGEPLPYYAKECAVSDLIPEQLAALGKVAA